MKHGFLKVACVTPDLLVGNPEFNMNEIFNVLKDIKSQIAVFPELCVTSYSCNDLFFQESLILEAKKAVELFLCKNVFKGIVIIGAPIDVKGALYNAAIVIQGNKILGIVPKYYLPNTQEFYEKRWFKSASDVKIKKIDYITNDVPFGYLLFEEESLNLRFGIEICEDMWAPISPGNILSVNGANMIINISASNETLGKDQIRRHAVADHSRRNAGSYVYTSAGVNESTSDTVFSGHNIIAANGKVLVEKENFSISSEVIYGDIDLGEINFKRRMNSSLRDSLDKFYIDCQTIKFNLEYEEIVFEKEIDNTPFVPKDDIKEKFIKIASLQEFALFKRLKHLNSKNVVIGVSGGLDSTLALLVCHQAFLKLGWDPKGIIAVTMPGLATSNRTRNNALELMEKLQVTNKQIDIKQAVLDHFDLIEYDQKKRDVTYENAQARMRTMILMDLANKNNGFVIGTGDMSELALGWCTYNGDQMSMYGINAGIPKTLVRFMVYQYAMNKYQEVKDCLLDIVNTPISPELIENQKTEENVGKYEINDFIMYRFLECGDENEKIAYLLQKAFALKEEDAKTYVHNFFARFYSQQYKRQASPDGPKILDISLAPRGDFRMTSDVKRGKI